MNSNLRKWGFLSSIPMVLAAGPLLGYVIGNFLDRKLKTPPWFLVVFLVLGFTASVRETVRLIDRARKEDER